MWEYWDRCRRSFPVWLVKLTINKHYHGIYNGFYCSKHRDASNRRVTCKYCNMYIIPYNFFLQGKRFLYDSQHFKCRPLERYSTVDNIYFATTSVRDNSSKTLREAFLLYCKCYSRALSLSFFPLFSFLTTITSLRISYTNNFFFFFYRSASLQLFIFSPRVLPVKNVYVLRSNT